MLDKFTEEVREIWKQKKIVDELKDRLKEEVGQLEEKKREALKKLEAAELDKYNVPGFGTISRVKKFSVRVPKDRESKKALFKYIHDTRGEDVLENMLSINSATLNSFYKEERKEAIDRGDIDWCIPGIDEPEVYWQLGMRKG